jgi:SRSO17 transposase
VSLTLASREVPVMVGLRLFLPEEWTNDPERMARARVPEERQTALTKPEIAMEEIDRFIASGARFGCVLADSGYGSSGSFRQALSERGLKWAVGLSRRQNVYPADVALIFPVAKRPSRNSGDDVLKFRKQMESMGESNLSLEPQCGPPKRGRSMTASIYAMAAT